MTDRPTPPFDGRVRPRADTGVAEAFLPAPCPQNHAANLATLPDGALGCVWFGGTLEGKSDISVWFARLPTGGDRWSQPVRLSDDPDRSEQNPILFQPPDNGPLWLIHTAQVAGNQDTAVVRRRLSHDGGRSWGPTDTLLDGGAGVGIFVRQPPLVADDGAWLLPVFLCPSVPGGKWVGDADTSAVMRSTDKGESWTRHDVPDSLGQVHMSIVRGPGASLVALYRSRWADSIHRSVSHDHGVTWSAPEPTTLPNNNSSIQATNLADGSIALVYNPRSAADATGRRASLYDELEDADDAPPPPRDPGTPSAFWGTPRAPLRLNWSSDGGLSWAAGIDLETGDGFCMTNNSTEQRNRELSYPSVHQAADGTLHVAFTWHRRSIEHVAIAPDAFARLRAGAAA